MSKDNELFKIKCKKCNNEQIIYSRISNIVKCLRCNTEIAKPTGGKALIIEENSEMIEVIK